MLALKVDGIIVHNSGTRGDTKMEAVRRYHIEVNGWKDIGYHYFIERDGTLRVGRPAHQVGAHVGKFNWNPLKRTYLLGICLAGNCELDQPTPAQMHTLVQLLAILCKRHDLGVHQIKGHRDLMPGLTVCPGRYLYGQLPLVRDEVGVYLPQRRLAA